MKVNKYILVLLFVSLSFAERPYTGLWEQEGKNEHFYVKVHFHADLGHWQFEYTSYLVDLIGEPTKQIVEEKYLSGKYFKLAKKLPSIIICKTDKILINGINIEIGKEKITFALRMVNDSTATFGLLEGRDIYEAYLFKKRE